MEYELASSAEIFRDKILSGFKKPVNYLPHIELHITHHCNLNCARCGHFAPLAATKNLNTESIINDLIQLENVTHKKHPDIITILGGEPLLNKDIVLILESVTKLFSDTMVILITNGILLDKMANEFWDVIKEKNIVISITKYFKDSFYNNLKELFNRLEVPDAKYNIAENSVYSTTLFVNLSLSKNGYGHTTKEMFENCPTHNLYVQLRDGRLYSCSTSAYLDILEDYFHEGFDNYKEIDGISIYNNSLEDIISFLNQPKKTCKYCCPNSTDRLYFPEHSKKEKSEWINP